MVNIGIKKKIFYHAILVFILLGYPVMATFYPTQNQDMEGVYNVTNVSYVFANRYCFNDGTCLTSTSQKVQGGKVTMWEVAFMISVIGTAFLFVYISKTIGTGDESEGFIRFAYMGLKLLLILSALILPMVAIQSNQGMWAEDGLNTTRLDTYHVGAWRIALWTPIIFVSLFVLFAFFEYFRKAMWNKREGNL